MRARNYDMKIKLAHIVSCVRNETANTPVKLNQHANMWVAELVSGAELDFSDWQVKGKGQVQR